MGCEHAETTTLLWLYGEAADAHAVHVAGCAACQEVVRTHEEVVSALGPALSATAAADGPRRLGRRGVGAATLLALAAALLLWVGVPPAAPPASERVVPAPSADPFDAALDDLDLELDRLSLELEML